MGLIPDFHQNEWDKPKGNTLVEQMVEEGVFGADGASLEAIAVGGMHSLTIDKNRTVSDMFLLLTHECSSTSVRYGLLVSTTKLR